MGDVGGWLERRGHRRRTLAGALSHFMPANLALALCLVLPCVICGFVSAARADEPAAGLKPISIGFVRHAYGTWTAKIADGGFETATGRTLRWLPYDTDSVVAAALASGRIDIGLIGTGVAAAAYARGLDLKIFFVMGGSPDTEGLVLHGTMPFRIGDPKSLAGKVVAVPFGSTPHFRLLQSLKRWSIPPAGIRIVNLQTAQIGEAWGRGELDAAVVSEPLLGRLKETGRNVPLSGGGGYEGLMVLAASARFVVDHVVFLARFVDVISRADLLFANMSGPLTEDRAEVRSIAFLTGMSPALVIAAIARYRPPPLSEQASPQWLGGGAAAMLVAALKAHAETWRWGGRADRMEADFTSAIATTPVERALEYQR